jgi:hypothetical protein
MNVTDYRAVSLLAALVQGTRAWPLQSPSARFDPAQRPDSTIRWTWSISFAGKDCVKRREAFPDGCHSA